MIEINPRFYRLNRCYLSGSESSSNSFETVTNQQVGVGSGGAGIGAYSNGNIISVTSSDVNALQANQNVSETAINAEGSTAAYALQELERGNENSNVVALTGENNNAALAHDAENTAVTVATEGLNLASQVASGSGFGQQATYAVSGDGSVASDGGSTPSLTTITLVLGVLVSVATLYYYYKHK